MARTKQGARHAIARVRALVRPKKPVEIVVKGAFLRDHYGVDNPAATARAVGIPDVIGYDDGCCRLRLPCKAPREDWPYMRADGTVIDRLRLGGEEDDSEFHNGRPVEVLWGPGGSIPELWWPAKIIKRAGDEWRIRWTTPGSRWADTFVRREDLRLPPPPIVLE